MHAYRINGSAKFGRQTQAFKIDVVAESDEDATHRALSIIGSKHRLSRRAIHIDGVDQIDPRTSSDPNVINTFRDEIEAAGPITSSEE